MTKTTQLDSSLTAGWLLSSNLLPRKHLRQKKALNSKTAAYRQYFKPINGTLTKEKVFACCFAVKREKRT